MTKPRTSIRKDDSKLSRHKVKPIIGWREHIDLPELGIFALNAKIDTGARTSALHVTKVNPFQGPDGSEWLELHIPIPNSKGNMQDMVCEMPSGGTRHIKSSSGHLEERYVLTSKLVLGTFEKNVEITLTNRMSMRYDMLIGRTALRNHVLINPGKSFLLSSNTLQPMTFKKE